jgi:hypothetical protein
MEQGQTRFRIFSRFRVALCLGLSCALLMAVSGCRNPELGELPEPVRTALFAPRPPLFLTAPVGSLFTNVQAFSAHVTLRRGADQAETVAGELLGLNGKLFFVPEKDEPLGKHTPKPGFSFIWDPAENRGWLLSEALQGYAPTSSSLSVTSMTTQVSAAATQVVNGHPARPETDTFQLSNGSTSVLKVFRATDLRGFPVQISSAGDSAPVTISFTRIKLQAPEAHLFSPPEGFTKYNSGEAMVDELAARQRQLHGPRY